MIEAEVQKYAQVFAGCEIRLTSHVLTSALEVLRLIGDPIQGTIAAKLGLKGIRVQIEPGEPPFAPMRWVSFEATDGHRCHRFACVVPLPAVAGGTWYTTMEAIAAAKSGAAEQEMTGGWQRGRLVLERRASDWPQHPEHFLKMTAPRHEACLTAAHSSYAHDYIYDALRACRAVSEEVVIQPPLLHMEPMRFDAGSEGVSGVSVTCVVMPRSPRPGGLFRPAFDHFAFKSEPKP